MPEKSMTGVVSPKAGRIMVVSTDANGHVHILSVQSVKPSIREMVDIAGWLHALPKKERAS